MRIYEEVYGDDIDGDKGRLVTNYELEDEDYETISSQIKEQFEGFKANELPEFFDAEMYDYIDDKVVQIEVKTKDYIRGWEYE